MLEIRLHPKKINYNPSSQPEHVRVGLLYRTAPVGILIENNGPLVEDIPSSRGGEN